MVAILNLAYFGIEFAVAVWIGSASLFADSIDFLEDASDNHRRRRRDAGTRGKQQLLGQFLPPRATQPDRAFGNRCPRRPVAAQCPANGTPSIAVADIHTNPADPARPWRRTGIYQPHLVDDDQRSNDRGMF